MVGLGNDFEAIREDIVFVLERMVTNVRIGGSGEWDTGARGKTPVFVDTYRELASCAANIDSRAAVTGVFINDRRTQRI